jgi:hypothetical protein
VSPCFGESQGRFFRPFAARRGQFNPVWVNGRGRVFEAMPAQVGVPADASASWPADASVGAGTSSQCHAPMDKNDQDPGHGATVWLVCALMYGGGLRLLEALQLRVTDVDLDRREIVVRSGKGQKDRRTVLPGVLIPRQRSHLGHRQDPARGRHQDRCRRRPCVSHG